MLSFSGDLNETTGSEIARMVFDDLLGYCADLCRTAVGGADLTFADLSNADLSNADLTGADLTDAKIDAASWSLLSAEQQTVAIQNLTLVGDTYHNILTGGEGNDTFNGGDGKDLIEGEAGDDTVHLSSSDVFVGRSISRNTTTDDRVSVEGVTRFSSMIDGGEDVDTIYLTDSSSGDAFFLYDSYSGLHESLTAVDDGFGRETVGRVISVETINAGDGDDVTDLTSPTFDMADVGVTLNGEGGNDTLWAAEGDDTLNGGVGDDVMFGEKGNDNFTGGAGADILKFVSSKTTQANTSEDQLKFYLARDENELNDSNIVNGDLVWGNVTIDLAGVAVASLGELKLSTILSKADD